MRPVHVTVWGRTYVPAFPSPAFIRYVCELGDAAYAALAWGEAEHWYQIAISHAPACCDGQPWEAASRFVDQANQQRAPRERAAKLSAACEVLKGSLP